MRVWGRLLRKLETRNGRERDARKRPHAKVINRAEGRCGHSIPCDWDGKDDDQRWASPVITPDGYVVVHTSRNKRKPQRAFGHVAGDTVNRTA